MSKIVCSCCHFISVVSSNVRRHVVSHLSESRRESVCESARTVGGSKGKTCANASIINTSASITTCLNAWILQLLTDPGWSYLSSIGDAQAASYKLQWR